MPLTAAMVIGGTNLVSGYLANEGAQDAANSARNAGREANATNLEIAKIAADTAKFKPYSITSGYGKSFFDTEKGTAGYELDPRLAAFRDLLYGQAEQAMAGVGTPEEEAQKYYQQQMGLLSPSRTQEDIMARERGLQTGRIGLGVSAGYGGAGDVSGMLNPDDFARMRARELANAQIANESTTYGQNLIDKLIARSTGLFSAGAGVEELGMKNLTIGADIGNKASVSQGQQANALLTGGLAGSKALLEGSNAATQYELAGNLNTARMIQGAGNAVGNMDFSNFKNPFSGMFTQAPASPAIDWNQQASGTDNSSYWKSTRY
jgi:hypothetical protein